MITPLYGQLSPLRIPTQIRRAAVSDSAAEAYLQAVETADGLQLEQDVANAINSFVVGCKSDGIWSAIKASCILAGARTLSGALVPLVGSAPTNSNFVSGDFDRKNGLKGNGSTKRLNSNYFFPTSNQNNAHAACFASEITGAAKFLLGDAATIGSSSLTNISVSFAASQSFSRLNCVQQTTATLAPTSGTFAVSRSAGPSFNFRRNGATQIVSVSSAAPLQVAMSFFSRTNSPASFFDGRLSFYSIGENLDLALLDTRVSNLMTALAAAIP
jgi:hypothetical protein